MVSFSSVALFALAYASCLVNAIPLVGRDDLDVAAPPVTYPTQGVVWRAGEKQTVTWDTSKLPQNITNPIGKVVLGWVNSGGLNLQNNAPLADGFPITAGSVDIIVPSQYPDGNSYIIALIGSSGNISPVFTITGGSSSPGTVSPSPTTSSSPAPQPTPVPSTSPTTTPGSGPSIQDIVPTTSPTLTPSTPSPQVSSSSQSSKSSSSPSPSSTQGNTNGGTSASDSSSGWSNKPANAMVVSLFAASLVTLFL